jgi:hypothetical protein
MFLGIDIAAEWKGDSGLELPRSQRSPRSRRAFGVGVSQENVDKAREFIAAYNRRDFNAAIKDFDPEIEWTRP